MGGILKCFAPSNKSQLQLSFYGKTVDIPQDRLIHSITGMQSLLPNTFTAPAITMPSSLKSRLSSLLFAASLIQMASAIPISYNLKSGQMECLYSAMRMSEVVTTSVFVAGGEELVVRTTLQGPLAPYEVSSSAEVLAAAMRLDKLGKDKKNLQLNRVEELDFENLYHDDVYMDDYDDDFDEDDDDASSKYELDDDVDDIIFRDYYYMDDDDEYKFIEDDAMDDIEVQELRKLKAEHEAMDPSQKEEEARKRKAARDADMKRLKDKREEAKQRRLAEIKDQKRRARENKKMQRMQHAHLVEGDPVEKTFMIEEEGWYRFCAEASKVEIDVEFEMRTSSELGQPNKKTGHIQTYERHDMMQNEKKLVDKLEKAAKEGAGSIKEADLKTTKNSISKMNRLLNEIREKQTNERRRLTIHKAVNEHSHSRMVVGSLFETVFYIVVSGFQVYTIRKWFSGNAILG